MHTSVCPTPLSVLLNSSINTFFHNITIYSSSISLISKIIYYNHIVVDSIVNGHTYLNYILFIMEENVFTEAACYSTESVIFIDIRTVLRCSCSPLITRYQIYCKLYESVTFEQSHYEHLCKCDFWLNSRNTEDRLSFSSSFYSLTQPL